MPEGPPAWERVAEAVVHEGDRPVARWTFRRPDGSESGFDITLHGDAVCVLALTPERGCILVRQYRPGPGRVLWDPPSGFVDDGEEPVAAATRELREETGYEGDIRLVGRLTPQPYSTEVRHVFVAADCRRVDDQDLDADEDVVVEIVDLEVARQLLREGAISASDAVYLALDAEGLLMSDGG